MNVSISKESAPFSKRSKKIAQKTINVTDFLNSKDPKNLKQKIFELLATGQGELEITNQTVSLSISNRVEREKFYAAWQHNH